MEEKLSEKLILRISSQNSSSIPWLVWSQATKDVIASGESEQQNLSVLTEYAKGRHVTVLVDSADVRLHRHILPGKPTRQLMKALPFMLEDELAEDIDKLHFAIENSGYDKELEQHWVNLAIVKTALMQKWLSLFEQANIQVKTMLPDVLCLPSFSVDESTTSVSLLGYADGWLVREDHWAGWFLSSDWFEMYIDKLIAKTEQTSSSDSTTELSYFSPLSQTITDKLAGAQQIKLKAEDPELPMLLLAQQADGIKWNLLQGEFSVKKAISKNWALWQPAALLLAVVCVIQFLMTMANWYNNTSALEQAKAQLAQEYKAAFPKERLRVNILRTQLKRKVAAISGDTKANSGGFIALFNKLTPVLSKRKAIAIDSIRYDEKRGEFRLSATAPSFQQFELFKNDIEQLGLSVQQGAVNNEGSSVAGSLSIKEAM